jgi:hypothetical protein
MARQHFKIVTIGRELKSQSGDEDGLEPAENFEAFSQID